MTTKKQFDLFVKTATQIIKMFGLYEWHIDMEHGSVEKDGAIGDCFYDLTGRSCKITLSDEYEMRDADVKITAVHEVCEILFAELDYLMKLRATNSDELIAIEVARHTVIRRLENILVK